MGLAEITRTTEIKRAKIVVTVTRKTATITTKTQRKYRLRRAIWAFFSVK